MTSRSFRALALVCCTLFCLSLPVAAKITSIKGRARVNIEEVRSGHTQDSDEASDSFPETVSKLPLQVSAGLQADSPEVGAGGGAGQFADPRTLDQPNPEEFAMNLALSSATEHLAYRGVVTLEEIRGVEFQSDEVGGAAAGERVDLIGTLFLDGALTVFSNHEVTDLHGAKVRLSVTVSKQDSSGASHSVFDGFVELMGKSDGTVIRHHGGDFPVSTLLFEDFAPLNPEFGVFQVLIIPPITIDYDYDAVVGEPFTLRAIVRVTADNGTTGLGVAGVLGTPVDTLGEVIRAANGETMSRKVVSMLASARHDGTGQAAFPDPPVRPAGCGLLGLEFVAGLFGLVALKRRHWVRRVR